MKVAFYDAKPYDRPGFDRYAQDAGLEIKYFDKITISRPLRGAERARG